MTSKSSEGRLQGNSESYPPGDDLSPECTGGIYRHVINKGIECSNTVFPEGTLLTVDIVGRHDKRVFDKRYNLQFHFGDGFLRDIPAGVEEGLRHFCINEKSCLTLRPEFAFGEKGNEKFGVPPNATVKYEVLLKSYARPIDSNDMSLKEKYVCAELLKERGTAYFRIGEFSKAHRKYSQAVNYLSDVEFCKERADYDRFLCSCFLNLAMCSLKTNDANEAIKWCNKALKLEPKNVKAYYRLGLANMTKQEPHIATECFQNVLELEPDNKAAVVMLLDCNHLRERISAMEKNLYAKFFAIQN